jgi:hypothetical protein
MLIKIIIVAEDGIEKRVIGLGDISFEIKRAKILSDDSGVDANIFIYFFMD